MNSKSVTPDATYVEIGARMRAMLADAPAGVTHPHWCNPKACEPSEDGTSVTHHTGFYRQAQRWGARDGWEPIETPLVWVRVSQTITTWDETPEAMRVDVKFADGLTLADLAEAADQVRMLAREFDVMVAPTFETPCPPFCQHDKVEPTIFGSRGHEYEVSWSSGPYPQGTRTRVHWGVVGKCVMEQYEIVKPDGTVVLHKRQISRRATAADLAAARKAIA